jgi:hypothetical protein
MKCLRIVALMVLTLLLASCSTNKAWRMGGLGVHSSMKATQQALMEEYLRCVKDSEIKEELLPICDAYLKGAEKMNQ